MRIVLCALGFMAMSAGAAWAADAQTGQAKPASDAARAPRLLYVCDTDAMTRRAFAREFGAAEFVTAERARAKGEAWTGPKCIRPAEARRLKQLASVAR